MKKKKKKKCAMKTTIKKFCYDTNNCHKHLTRKIAYTTRLDQVWKSGLPNLQFAPLLFPNIPKEKPMTFNTLKTISPSQLPPCFIPTKEFSFSCLFTIIFI
jgi:hypothetical protein